MINGLHNPCMPFIESLHHIVIWHMWRHVPLIKDGLPLSISGQTQLWRRIPCNNLDSFAE